MVAREGAVLCHSCVPETSPLCTCRRVAWLVHGKKGTVGCAHGEGIVSEEETVVHG